MRPTTVREALALLKPQDREKLALAFEEQISYCVPLLNDLILGVNLNAEGYDVIDQSGVWILGKVW